MNSLGLGNIPYTERIEGEPIFKAGRTKKVRKREACRTCETCGDGTMVAAHYITVGETDPALCNFITIGCPDISII